MNEDSTKFVLTYSDSRYNKNTFENIKSESSGSVMDVTVEEGKTLKIEGSVFKTCVCGGNGGALNIYVEEDGSVEFNDVEFDSCTASSGNGGAVSVKFVGEGSMKVENVDFTSCGAASATAGGGSAGTEYTKGCGGGLYVAFGSGLVTFTWNYVSFSGTFTGAKGKYVCVFING